MKSTSIKSLLAVSAMVTTYGLNSAQADFTKLHDFDQMTDGAYPSGGVALSGTKLFGLAPEGGENNLGTLWSFDTGTGTFTTLHNFGGVVDGANPRGGVAVSGTTIFGTATSGGTHDLGTLWSFDTNTDTYTKLYDFSGVADGDRPLGDLLFSGSKIFGTTNGGGDVAQDGTLWSFDTSTGTFSNRYVFHNNRYNEVEGGISGDGGPTGGIALTGTSNFLTITLSGGFGYNGGLWKFDTVTNSFTVLGDFRSEGSPPLVGRPSDGVAVFRDSVLWTTQPYADDGAIWWTGENPYSKLTEFEAYQYGRDPKGRIVLSGSKLFGTAREGGVYGDGTVWSFDTSTEEMTKLHDFSRMADGADPIGGVAVSGARLFGTANTGGAHGYGTLWYFRLAVPEPSTWVMIPICLVLGVIRRGRNGCGSLPLVSCRGGPLPRRDRPVR